MSTEDPGPRRDSRWLLLLGLLFLIYVLWTFLERTNRQEPGGVKEGAYGREPMPRCALQPATMGTLVAPGARPATAGT